jgi:NAD(P)-dependent dehydrogenase (short-subunit alcohol dehydrogenase family)
MVPAMGLLSGKVVIITGSGNGIGRSHAHYMSKLGAKIVVNDVGTLRDGSGAADKKAADTVVEEIVAQGGEAVASHDSVTAVEGAQNLVWTALSKFGRVDVLVNNAGILRDKTLLNMTEAEFDAVLAVHAKGTWLCTQAVGRQLRLQKSGGRIINTSSVSGLMGNFGQANYSAAKAAIYGLTRTASMEFQKFNVTVNAIAPVALTRMTKDLPMFKGISEDDLGPQHISPVVAFLASDLSADITGKIFGVEGKKVYEYRMEVSEGVIKSDGNWTPEAIKEQLAHIMK